MNCSLIHSQEIQKRCESIVKMVEKELEDIRKVEEAQEAAKSQAQLAAAAAATGGSQTMGTHQMIR